MTGVNASAACDCYHCGLPVKTPGQFSAVLGGEQREFCCPACCMVAQCIYDNGFAQYYRYSETAGVAASTAASRPEHYTYVDDEAFQQQYVTHTTEGRSEINLWVSGMHCAACVWLLENYLKKIPAVKQVRANLSEQRVAIGWDQQQTPLSEIFNAIARIGYEPEVFNTDNALAHQRQENRTALRRIGIAGIAMMQVGMYAIAMYFGAVQGMDESLRNFMRILSMLITTPVVFYSAQPFFYGAWRGLRLGKPGIDLPVAVAIGLAYGASLWATFTAGEHVYFDSVSMFTFLLLLGRYLEMRARHQASQFGGDLLAVLPNYAECLVIAENGERSWQTRVLSSLRRGDIVRVKPGEVIPVDGLIQSGNTKVNEAQLSGEFWPVSKTPGDAVIAGTANISQLVEIEAKAVGAELYLQQLNELVDVGKRQKPRIELLVDRIASVFVFVIISLALSGYVAWYFLDADSAFWVMLSVLVVSCPCALSLATPTVLTSATQALRARGLLVREADVWEKLDQITDVVFDKTGTLTTGNLTVSDCHPLGDLSREQCLEIIAALESPSTHPIAQAFKPFATGTAVSEWQQDLAMGISARVGNHHYRFGNRDYAQAQLTEQHVHSLNPGSAEAGENTQQLLLCDEHRPLCFVTLQDVVRSDVPRLLEFFKGLAVQTHILSGDPSGSAGRLAKHLRINHCFEAASPEAKQQYVKQLQQQGRKVLMIGDGINDLPVMSVADVSLAVANANGVAKVQADAILLSPSVAHIEALYGCAAKAKRLIRQNIVWALSYNVIAIPLALAAVIPPYFAALGMSVSSLFVTLNAMRVLKTRLASRQQAELGKLQEVRA